MKSVGVIVLRSARILVVLATIVTTTACSGSTGSGTSPSTLSGGCDPSFDQRCQIGAVAPAVGQTVGSVLVAALRHGVTQSAANETNPTLGRLVRLLGLVPEPLLAQSGRWTWACPGGGNARIDLPDSLPFIGQVTLTNTATVWSACATNVGSTPIAANGQLMATGTFTTSNPNNTIQLQGALQLTNLGSVPFIGNVDGSGVYLGQIGTVTVGAPSCVATLSATTFNAPATGGLFNVSINLAAGCTWLAGSLSASFITVTAGTNGTGNGATTFSVAANTGAARTGSLNVAGIIVTVNQAGVAATPCVFSVSPSALSFASNGGSSSVAVAASPTGCSPSNWTAGLASGSFITISPSSGTGNGSVTVTAASNNGAQRTGSVTIAGTTVAVSQDAQPSTLNLTGTWTLTSPGSSGSGMVRLTQSGTTLSGNALGLATSSQLLISDSITGTISGTAVNLTETQTFKLTDPSVSCTGSVTGRYVLTASSSSAMSGPYTWSGTITCVVPGGGPPITSPYTASGDTSWVKTGS